MSLYLLDVSVVLALLDPQHVFHGAAHAWATRESEARWITCPLVQNGVIRIASQSAYSRRLGTLVDVRDALRQFCAQPRHAFCPDDISIVDDRHLARVALLGPATLTDVYLLALARHHGARLATFDRRVPVDAVPDGASALAVIPA